MIDLLVLSRSLRQLCQAGQHKLAIAVKTDVVIKEHQSSLQNLKTIVDNTRCSYKYKAAMYQKINNCNNFNRFHRFHADNLRQYLISMEKSL